jgi:hypothetical protein
MAQAWFDTAQKRAKNEFRAALDQLEPFRNCHIWLVTVIALVQNGVSRKPSRTDVVARGSTRPLEPSQAVLIWIFPFKASPITVCRPGDRHKQLAKRLSSGAVGTPVAQPITFSSFTHSSYTFPTRPLTAPFVVHAASREPPARTLTLTEGVDNVPLGRAGGSPSGLGGQ